MESTRRCARAVFVLFTRGFQGGARPKRSRAISQASFSHANHTIRFLNVPIFSGMSARLKPAIMTATFLQPRIRILNRHIPDFILEAVEDTNLIGRVGNAGKDSVGPRSRSWPPRARSK